MEFIEGGWDLPVSLMERFHQAPSLSQLEPCVPQEPVVPVKTDVSRPVASSSLAQLD